MATYRVDEGTLVALLGERDGVFIFAPSPTERLPWMGVADAEASLAALRQPRSAQSAKGLFFPAAESVGRYGSAAPPAAQDAEPRRVVAGVRACELRAQTYLDKVLLEGEFEDPAYRRRREATVVIACDCVDCAESCACTLTGGRPFAADGFDLNVSPLDDGFLVEVGTPKGEAWLTESVGSDLPDATPGQVGQRDAARERITQRVREQNARFTFAASDESQPALPNDADDGWRRFSGDCVECGACTHICPTCHCFYLYDQALGPEEFERLRTWDSCLLSSYHRMAGGPQMKLSPRPGLSSRLANRVLHKFTYSPQQYGLLGCVGCGRCIDACPGAIDIREVVQELGE